MWTPAPEALAAAFAHARTTIPREACGVMADGRFVPLFNEAGPVVGAFRMDMRAYERVRRQGRSIEAIVHSHVRVAPAASDADRIMCDALGLPWLILETPRGRYSIIRPESGPALIGRNGGDDAALVRDALRAYAGLDLPAGDSLSVMGLNRVRGGWLHLDAAQLTGGRLAVFFAPGEILLFEGGRSTRLRFGEALRKQTLAHYRHPDLAP